MATESPFAPVEKLDAPAVVGLVNELYGLGLRYAGPCLGGNVGAAFVDLPDRHRCVLTWQGGSDVERHRQIGELLDLARGHGIPVARYEHVLAVGSGVAVIQQQLPGATPALASQDLVEQLVAINERCRGVLAGRADIAAAPLHLRSSGPGFCLHEPLAAYSDRTRRLLDWIREVGADTPEILAGSDLVHLDFQPANVLVDSDGRITGIIDWDGAARGDSRIDLVVLLFGLHSGYGSAATIEWLSDRIHQQLTDDELRPYWASMSLRMVDWSIRHYSAEDVERWIDVAESGIDR